MRRDIQPYSTAGIRGSIKKKSPGDQARDLRRAAQRNRQLADVARMERSEAWSDGGRNEFLADRQEKTAARLSDEKRGLRRDVYRQRPELEGREYDGTISLRGRR